MNALSEARIRHAETPTTIKKLSDGQGLVLLLHPNGSKYWRFNYRFNKKQKTLAIGKYPDISLKEARAERELLRKSLREGQDPALKNQAEEDMKKRTTFFQVAKEWWEAEATRWTPKHARTVWHSLEVDVLPEIGNEDITLIETPRLLLVIKAVEARDVNDTAIRVLQRIKCVFNYAIQTGLIKINPALPLTGVIRRKKEVHRLALPQSELPGFFQKLGEMQMAAYLRIAMKLQIIWFVRPNELRFAKWEEINFDRREWHIPAEKMKMRRPHIVPLSNWAIELLLELKEITGRSPYLFFGAWDSMKPISENTISYIMARMGYKGKAVPHGFRSLATDVLNENGFDADIVERQLAHVEANKIRRAYHRTEYLDQRHEMMEWYSNWIRQFDRKS